MRKLGLSLALLVFCFSCGPKPKDTKAPVSPLAGLKPWEVPFIPPTVQDTLGAADTLFLDLKKGDKEGEWVLYHSVFTDEPLFALSFTLRHDSLMTFDSISLAGTRIEFFQTQMVNRPPEFPNTITVGLFSALNPQAPPLEPGRGLVMKMHFRAPASRPISIRSVATINIPPGLEFVTPQGTPIHPAVVRIGDGAAAAPPEKTEPAKPAAPSKRKRKG